VSRYNEDIEDENSQAYRQATINRTNA